MKVIGVLFVFALLIAVSSARATYGLGGFGGGFGGSNGNLIRNLK